MFWPTHGYRDDRRILVAGCGSDDSDHREPRQIDGIEAVVGYDETEQRRASNSLYNTIRGIHNFTGDPRRMRVGLEVSF